MKTKWYAIAMLTILMMLSVSVVQVEAAALGVYGDTLLNDGGDDGGGDAPEAFGSAPSAMNEDGVDSGDTQDAE